MSSTWPTSSASSGNDTASLREAPRPARKQPTVDADELMPAAGDQEEATEADAPSGGGDGGGFVLD
jgi:hypothetical protein